MTNARFFDWFLLAMLACWGCVAIGRMLTLYARGVRVLAVDWQRTPAQIVCDSLLGLSLLSWLYMVFAYSWPLPDRFAGGDNSSVYQ